MHDFAEGALAAVRRGGFGEERLAARHKEVQPIKRRVSSAFPRAGMFDARRKHDELPGRKLVFAAALAYMHFSCRDEYDFVGVQRYRAVNPGLVGVEQPRVIVFDSFVVKRNQVGFSHLIRDFLIANSRIL